MPLPYFYSFDTSRPPELAEMMATDADSVLIEYLIPNDHVSFSNNGDYFNELNNELFDREKEKMEEEFPRMTAPTSAPSATSAPASSCEQRMGNTYVAPPTQNPELELPLTPRWLEYLINFERMRNKLDPTVPVQGEMSLDCFESPQPYQYTDLTNSFSQTGNFKTLGDIQSHAHQGSELINLASANVYYTNFDNDLTTNANFSQEHHYLSSPETSDFDGAETLSPSSQESIFEVSDTEDRPLKCRWTNCVQGFSNLTELAKHLKDSHVKTIQQNDFVCLWEGCSKRLSSGYKLLAHLRTHSGEKPHECPISGCEKAFSTAESLKIHIRRHTGEKPCKCRFCDKAYADTSDCRKHERTHTCSRPYACQINGCNKRYTDPSSLRKHKKRHSANEQERLMQRRRG